MPQKLKILFEDNHLLVVNKPAMLPTMGVGPAESSLLKLGKQYIKSKYGKPGNVYLGVVSRLDKLVSGVIVFARTSKAADRLNRQFSSGSVKKTYLAIIPGRLEAAQGTLTNWLVKDEANQRMNVIDDPGRPGAKQAQLQYRLIGRHNDQWLVEIELHTGRKHQIRVQFSASNCPIVGDKKYGSRAGFKCGIALHSRSLAIVHPTRKTELEFESNPPEWWNLARFGVR